jgi:hypothetical protein
VDQRDVDDPTPADAFLQLINHSNLLSHDSQECVRLAYERAGFHEDWEKLPAYAADSRLHALVADILAQGYDDNGNPVDYLDDVYLHFLKVQYFAVMVPCAYASTLEH